jgi:hypothetical protein
MRPPHYWCFDSPVGQALAILKLRIQDVAVGFAHTRNPHLLEFLARAFAKDQAAVAVLRPLDEGMACFAEFDMTTRRKSRAFEAAGVRHRPGVVEARHSPSIDLTRSVRDLGNSGTSIGA